LGAFGDKEKNKAQTEKFAKATREAAARIAQQNDSRCQSYGKPGFAAYFDCRTSLKSDRAEEEIIPLARAFQSAQ